MRLLQLLQHLLLVILCICALCLVTPCLDISTKNASNELCLVGSHKRRSSNDHFTTKALVETAQSRAYLSPVVFLGTLRSVLVQRDGTVRAWFFVEESLKSPVSNSSNSGLGPVSKSNSTKSGLGTLKKTVDLEVVYYRSGDHCILPMNQDNLKLGKQYLVFGSNSAWHTWPSLTATALPIPNHKRTLRAVKRILCKNCAKPPSLSGLQRTRVEEGGKGELHCHLAGNPIPWVEWYKDGQRVVDRGRIRVKTRRRTSRLVIRRIRLSDRGVYECRAGNFVQKSFVSSKATVVVVKKKTTTKRPPSHNSTPVPTISTTESSLWTTEPCPRNDFCLNGGTCMFFTAVREYVCHCAEGFIGLRCDFKDVSISVGERKNLDLKYDRLFIDILVLFLIFFCLNWICIAICWLCCFRCQLNSWGKFKEMSPLQKLLKKQVLSEPNKASESDALELNISASSNNRRQSGSSDSKDPEDDCKVQMFT